MARIGVLQSAIVGLLLILFSFVSLQVTFASVPLAACSRVLHGVGFGIFIPAATLFAKEKAIPSAEAYYVGVFSAAMMVPNLFAPAIGQLYLARFGPHFYFVLMSIPIVTGIGLCAMFLSFQRGASLPRTEGYIRLISAPGIFAPGLAMIATGCLWGYAATFLALSLDEVGIPAAFFFTPFAVGMLATRFFILRTLAGWSKRGIVVVSLALMSVSYWVLAETSSPILIAALAVVFAIGYGAVYPNVLVWGSGVVPPKTRMLAFALLNALFNVGGALTPTGGGKLIAVVDFSGTERVLACLGIVSAIVIAFGFARERCRS